MGAGGLEGAPAALRRSLRRTWLALGLKLAAAGDERAVLGWWIRRASDEVVLLGAGSRIGMPAELFVCREGEAVVGGTLLGKHNLLARLVWAPVEAPHRRVVPAVFARVAGVAPASARP